MRHLKFIKGLSYRGCGIVATKANPGVSVDNETAEKLLASGYFTEVSEPASPEPPVAPTGTIEAIDAMGVTKLRAYAKSKGLSLTWPSGTDAETIRADIRAALNESEESAAEERRDKSGNSEEGGE